MNTRPRPERQCGLFKSCAPWLNVFGQRQVSKPPVFQPKDLPPSDEAWLQGDASIYPTPEEIHRKSGICSERAAKAHRPDPVLFHNLGLIVKWGTHITTTEGQCMWYVREQLGDHVPVPKIYGWTRDAGQTFLYMELVQGVGLDERWDRLTSSEKRTICRQLGNMLQHLRALPRLSGWPLLSSVGGGPLHEIMFDDGGLCKNFKFEGDDVYPAGPFASAKRFHDCYAVLASRCYADDCEDPRNQVEELRGFNDGIPIVFTHADLDHSNILVSRPGDGQLRIVAIIDWHQSGWYPAPWEYLKMQSVAGCRSEWAVKYVPKLLPKPSHAYWYSWEFVSMATI